MADNNTNGNKTGLVLGALAIGAIAGAIGGILLAPKSGKETRADIAELAEKMKHDIVEKLSEISTITTEAYHNAVDTVVQKYQDTKSITAEEATELKQELAKHYDKIKETVESK